MRDVWQSIIPDKKCSSGEKNLKPGKKNMTFRSASQRGLCLASGGLLSTTVEWDTHFISEVHVWFTLVRVLLWVLFLVVAFNIPLFLLEQTNKNQPSN